MPSKTDFEKSFSRELLEMLLLDVLDYYGHGYLPVHAKLKHEHPISR
jgi:hypothetical protein